MKTFEVYQQGDFSYVNWHWQGGAAVVTVVTQGGLKGTFQVAPPEPTRQERLLPGKVINDSDLNIAAPNFKHVYEAPPILETPQLITEEQVSGPLKTRRKQDGKEEKPRMAGSPGSGRGRRRLPAAKKPGTGQP